MVSEETVKAMEKVRERMFRPTSRRDIEYMLGDKIKVLTYDELLQYSTFEDLMDPYHAIVILYPNLSTPDLGHWVTCFVAPGTNSVIYFDSYGCYIDEPIRAYNEEAEEEEREKRLLRKKRRLEPKLLELLIESPYDNEVFYNDTTFQSEDMCTNTCGLWCVVRLICNIYGENEFKKLYYDKPLSMDISPDLAVSNVICDIFPEMAV